MERDRREGLLENAALREAEAARRGSKDRVIDNGYEE
jgi:hypothetical protein